MRRYFLEVCYHGKAYSGFQVQDNAPSIQQALEKALMILTRQEVKLTGSSRTDAGVHARQNYFHFDTSFPFTDRHIYNINSLLPSDIAVNSLISMPNDAHCRFDAVARVYQYTLYQRKDPFLVETAYHYPYPLDERLLAQAAQSIVGTHDFSNYCKRNTQVKTFICDISESGWSNGSNNWTFRIRGNRFLRGMVRGLVGTMLKVGTGRVGLQDFKNSLDHHPSSIVDFAVPGKGLMLERVEFSDTYFQNCVRL
jgi:tRNA pseudouridine38-40 synthase